MIHTILKTAGLQYRETRFPKPPAGTYAVYMDDVETDGPDGYNCIFTHYITVELYATKPDPDAEAALEAALDEAGLTWRKQARYWLPTEQRYQTVYEFTYRKKRRL